MDDVIIYQPTINRAKFIGKKTRIGAFCDLGADVEIGRGCNIQAGVFLSNGVKVGDGVFIGPRVTVLNDNYMNAVIDPSTIGSFSRIGGGTIINPGVHIGNNCYVCSGALITRNVPDGAMILPEKGKKERVVW